MKTQTSYSVIDLFSGCGGSAYGFKSAGFNIKTAVEIDKTASETFKTNFPEATVVNDDIRNVSGKQLLRSSGLKSSEKDNLIILACPPCQGFSSARRNSQRQSDPRNLLVLEFVRLVEEIKPVAFVMENVPGLANRIGHEMLDLAIQRLKNAGYMITEPKVLEAIQYGVPQKRKRLVMMGTRLKSVNLSIPIPKYRKPDEEDSNLPKYKTVQDYIHDLPKISAGSKSSTDALHVAASLSETNLKRLIHTPHNGGDRLSWPDDLVLDCHKNKKGHTDVYGRMRWDSPSPTITGGCMMISKGRFGHPDQNRAISLREAARLQTFPDSFKFTGNLGEIAKQIGNAVPVLLAEAIALSLRNQLSNQNSVKNTGHQNEKSLRVGYFNNFV